MIFTKGICAVHASFSRSWHFNLDFQESRKFMKKLRNHGAGLIQPDPVFGLFFVTFFGKSSVFPSRAETTFRQPSAQPCPAGQSSKGSPGLLYTPIQPPGKNCTWSEKSDQKGSKNGVRRDHSIEGQIEVFS